MSDDAAARNRPFAIALIAAAAIAFALLRAPLLSVPLERDEGEYAYIAQRLQHGEIPYRDAFDQKPPGVFIAYRLALATFGESVEGIRLGFHVWLAATAVASFGLVRGLAGPLAAGFAVLAFAVASVDPGIQGFTANTEGWMLLPLVLAACACLRGWRTGERRWWLVCGACAALACWFKQVALTDAALFAAAAAGDAIIGRPRPGAREVGRRLGAFALGALLVSAPIFGWFAAQGAFAAFLDAVFLHNFAYAQGRSPGEAFENLRRALARQLPGFGVLWALAFAGWWLPGGTPARVRHALAAWWLAALAGAALGLHFRPHYFVQALPALTALAGIGCAELARRAAQRRPRAHGLAIAALAGALVAPPLFAHRALWLAESPDAIARRIYGLNPFPEAAAIADHIRRHSGADESVFIVGSEPEILFLAQRRSATRYIFFYPLTGDYPDARERQQQVVDEVTAARPRYLVWVDVPTSHLRAAGSESLVFDASLAMIRSDYALELLAHPDPGGKSYVIARGDEARRWIQAARAAGEPVSPTVAVYRRLR